MMVFDILSVSAKLSGLVMLLLLMYQIKKDLKRALREKAQQGRESHV